MGYEDDIEIDEDGYCDICDNPIGRGECSSCAAYNRERDDGRKLKARGESGEY